MALFRPKKLNRSMGGNLLVFLVLGLFAVFQMIPIVYTIGSAFKPVSELLKMPPTIFPRRFTTESFSELFISMSASRIVFSRYIFNSFFVTVCGVVMTIVLCSLAAYPLAKMHGMPGAKFLGWFIILAMMLSSDVSGMATFMIQTGLRIIDTPWSIILPSIGSAFSVFLLKQFMEQMVPDTLIEAAKIDGAGEFLVWGRIVLPVMKPAVLTLIIFSMQWLWNNDGSRIFSEQRKILPNAMRQIVDGGIARLGVAAAVGVFIMVVPITLFIILQSNVIETMATSGIKD